MRAYCAIVLRGRSGNGSRLSSANFFRIPRLRFFSSYFSDVNIFPATMSRRGVGRGRRSSDESPERLVDRVEALMRFHAKPRGALTPDKNRPAVDNGLWEIEDDQKSAALNTPTKRKGSDSSDKTLVADTMISEKEISTVSKTSSPISSPPVALELRTPHDFEFDMHSNRLSTPAEKARAWVEYLEEHDRKINDSEQLELPSEPRVYVTYGEGETLGSKRKTLSDGPLCEWFDRCFGGSFTEEQKQWIKEHRKYNTKDSEAEGCIKE